MFHASSPLPYGGPKQTPGYSEFLNSDNSNNQLLDFLVTAAFKAYWKFRGPVALNFLADSVNRVLGLQVAGAKDTLDELLLKGMKKSGQIEWFGPAQIPEHLRHQYQGRREEGVWFTPVLMRMDPSCRAMVHLYNVTDTTTNHRLIENCDYLLLSSYKVSSVPTDILYRGINVSCIVTASVWWSKAESWICRVLKHKQ
ncbi:hypothetical protein HDU79_010146 [Rhizoclosmatium sp. JEL0117]|nr:hypothetical protein HDU79_010146 [Rhizoclosmatium sp. JEL0117]